MEITDSASIPDADRRTDMALAAAFRLLHGSEASAVRNCDAPPVDPDPECYVHKDPA